MHLKEPEPAEKRLRSCCWNLCCCEPFPGLRLSGAVEVHPHAHFISLPRLIANFLHINYKVQSFSYWVWNREWGLTLEQKLSSSPIYWVHLRPRTHKAETHSSPFRKLGWLKLSLYVLKIKGELLKAFRFWMALKNLFLGDLERGVKLSQLIAHK